MRIKWILLLAAVACGPPTPEQKAQQEAEAKEEEAKERARQEAYDRAKRLERYYEIEWVKCVNDLGIDRCKVIQETGFHQCRSWQFRDEHGLDKCAEHRISDRLDTFPPEVSEEKVDEVAEGPQSLPAEDPVHP